MLRKSNYGISRRGNTYKLKFGHRGGNKPCIDLTRNRGFITSQNHGYAVDPESVKPAGFLPYFENADDHSNEGIYHPDKPCFAVQFHPEANPGPDDTNYLFDEFLKKMGFAPTEGGFKLNAARFKYKEGFGPRIWCHSHWTSGRI